MVKADDLRKICKYSRNLSELSEMSFNCNIDNDDECFDEFKNDEFKNLEKISISCIIICY